ncbi:hypothetical protein DY000_02006249 [Brassica cretica]|uniref:Uncharacterized protein n=1 Tax=Brassica cretica TaxID=69181 RepID=A0ABQ7CD77_BRACR|nr:hypothetical protein DY000_02006249 [Brassica cretica]
MSCASGFSPIFHSRSCANGFSLIFHFLFQFLDSDSPLKTVYWFFRCRLLYHLFYVARCHQAAVRRHTGFRFSGIQRLVFGKAVTSFLFMQVKGVCFVSRVDAFSYPTFCNPPTGGYGPLDLVCQRVVGSGDETVQSGLGAIFWLKMVTDTQRLGSGLVERAGDMGRAKLS